MKTFREVISADSSDAEQISESLVGKGFAVAQNRQHGSQKNKALSKLGTIQSDCRRAANEEDDQKRNELLFKILFDLATTLKIFAEMSSKNNNVSTAGVLDQENIKKILAPIIKRFGRR